MSKGNFNIPYPVNEPVLSYAPGTPEREDVLRVYREMYGQYGDDSFPEPDVLYGLSIEEIEELIDDLEEAEVAFELEYEKKRKS